MHKPDYWISTDGLMSPRDVVRLIHPEDLEDTTNLPDAILEELYAKTIILGPAYHEIVRALQDFHEMQEDYKNRKFFPKKLAAALEALHEQAENSYQAFTWGYTRPYPKFVRGMISESVRILNHNPALLEIEASDIVLALSVAKLPDHPVHTQPVISHRLLDSGHKIETDLGSLLEHSLPIELKWRRCQEIWHQIKSERAPKRVRTQIRLL